MKYYEIKKKHIRGGNLLKSIPIIKDIIENEESKKSEDNKYYIGRLIYDINNQKKFNPDVDLTKQAKMINNAIDDAIKDDPKFSQRTGITKLQPNLFSANEQLGQQNFNKRNDIRSNTYQENINNAQYLLEQGRINKSQYDKIVSDNKRSIEGLKGKQYKTKEYLTGRKDFRFGNKDEENYKKYDTENFKNDFYDIWDAITSGVELGAKAALG
jgi:hypothetical protein